MKKNQKKQPVVIAPPLNKLPFRGGANTLMIPCWLLTHVELADKRGHVVVLEELWENFFGKPPLVEHMETGTTLIQQEKKKKNLYYCGGCDSGCKAGHLLIRRLVV